MTEDFTGMCLENEYKVTSRKKTPSDAYFEIIKKIVDCIIDINNMSNEYPDKKYTPLLKVTDKIFLKKYDECKKSEKSSFVHYIKQNDSHFSFEKRGNHSLYFLFINSHCPVIFQFLLSVFPVYPRAHIAPLYFRYGQPEIW